MHTLIFGCVWSFDYTDGL